MDVNPERRDICLTSNKYKIKKLYIFCLYIRRSTSCIIAPSFAKPVHIDTIRLITTFLFFGLQRKWSVWMNRNLSPIMRTKSMV